MISAIIKKAGGPNAIARASADTLKPISRWAVQKWKTSGIPAIHWDMLMRLNSEITISDLYAANRSILPLPQQSSARGNGHAVAA